MLPAGNRLRRHREFATAVRQGRRAGRPLLVAHMYLARDRAGDRAGHVVDERADDVRGGSGGAVPRVGLVVGRTVGRAVVRNRVRRRLRHLLRERVDRLPVGALLVVRALPPAATASSRQLAADLDRALDVLRPRAPSGSMRASRQPTKRSEEGVS